MQTSAAVALGATLTLTLVHLHAGKLRFLEGIPLSRWLSLAEESPLSQRRGQRPAEARNAHFPQGSRVNHNQWVDGQMVTV